MKKYHVVQFICFLLVFLVGASLMVYPSLGLSDPNYLFFIIMMFYGLMTYILYLLVRRKDDYEYLFVALISVVAGASGILFRGKNPTMVLSLSLIGWMSFVSMVKLIKIDYYHDRGNVLWLIRTITFALYIIITTLTCINLYYNIEVQSLMLGYLFMIVPILECFDPISDYLVNKNIKQHLKSDLKPIVIKNDIKELREEKKKEIKKTSATKTKKSSTTKKAPLKKPASSKKATTTKKATSKTTK